MLFWAGGVGCVALVDSLVEFGWFVFCLEGIVGVCLVCGWGDLLIGVFGRYAPLVGFGVVLDWASLGWVCWQGLRVLFRCLLDGIWFVGVFGWVWSVCVIWCGVRLDGLIALVFVMVGLLVMLPVSVRGLCLVC